MRYSLVILLENHSLEIRVIVSLREENLVKLCVTSGTRRLIHLTKILLKKKRDSTFMKNIEFELNCNIIIDN